jgi:hypothetical protein
LDGAGIGLPLKTFVFSAVVGENQLVTCHSKPEIRSD